MCVSPLAEDGGLRPASAQSSQPLMTRRGFQPARRAESGAKRSRGAGQSRRHPPERRGDHRPVRSSSHNRAARQKAEFHQPARNVLGKVQAIEDALLTGSQFSQALRGAALAAAVETQLHQRTSIGWLYKSCQGVQGDINSAIASELHSTFAAVFRSRRGLDKARNFPTARAIGWRFINAPTELWGGASRNTVHLNEVRRVAHALLRQCHLVFVKPGSCIGCGADPLVRAGPPGPALRTRNQPHPGTNRAGVDASRRTGVLPTIG